VGSIVRTRLALILLLALVLRLFQLSERTLWYDEAFAVLFAEKGLDSMLYGTLTPVAGGAADIHPLLYYTTLNGWMAVFGESQFAVRLWSVVLGVATVGMIYLLARDLFGENTGLAAALITAVAPFHVQYSQETRMYALLGLLLVAAAWCFVRGARTPPPSPLPVHGEGEEMVSLRQAWGWWVTFGVLAALAMYTQQLAAFYLVALGLVPLLTRRRDLFIRVLVGAGIALVLYLPWLVNLPSQFAKVRSYYWIDKPGIGALLRTTFSFLVVNLDIPRSAFFPALAGAAFLLIFMVIQVVLYLRRRRVVDRQPLLFVLWLAGAPVLLMWLVSQLQPVYLERSLLPSALMLYVALAWFFTRGSLPRPIAGVFAVLGLGLVGVGLYYQYTWATFPNSPFRDAAAYLHANLQPGDVVIHQNKLSALPTIYYGRMLPQRYIGDTPGSPEDTLALPTQQALKLPADACARAAAVGAKRVWWVVFSFAEQQYNGATPPRREFNQAVSWLNAHYTAGETQHFNDLDVTLYSDPRGTWGADCGAG
jgi:4-amino-4-deoxy-L-arabinose transferase-like glycosyltransferase